MHPPRSAEAMKPGVHVYNDPFQRGWVVYYLISDDGQCVAERRYLEEIDGEWLLRAARVELATINAMTAPKARKTACGSSPQKRRTAPLELVTT